MPPHARLTTADADTAALLARQDGVVARRQLLGLGWQEPDLRRASRRRDLVAVHPGVYVDHTGPPTRRQREWAAVLLHWPAALHRESALVAHGLTRDRPARGSDQIVHVLVDSSRRGGHARDVVVERVKDASQWIHWNRSPPRATVELAVLKVAADRDDAGAIALMSDAVQQGRTTAPRLIAVLDRLPRLPRRAFLGQVLDDVALGTRSVLERRYLVDVERAHSLPPARRQIRVADAGGTRYRDVRYPAQHLVVELDGAFGHRDAADRWTDLDRDLAAAVRDEVTLRPGWAQVLEPCRLAGMVGAVLQRRGWTGAPTRCGPACGLDAEPLPSPGDCDGSSSASRRAG